MNMLSNINVGGQAYGMQGVFIKGTCATPAGTEVKVCSFTDSFELKVGTPVVITFTYANTYGDGISTYPKLSIGGVSYPVKNSSGAYAASGDWANGQTAVFMFDGTNFVLVNVDFNSVVSKALAVPTDAVLHYSFDEVPDLPDGAAVYRKNNDFTTTSDWDTNGTYNTLSIVNNCLYVKSSGTWNNSTIWSTYMSLDSFANKIVKIRFRASNVNQVFTQDRGGSYTNHSLSYKSLGGNLYEVCQSTESSYTYDQSLIIQYTNTSSDNYVSIEQFYIGDGSYATPVIDNANGEWNSVSQSGVAVQGVSGKGVLCYGGNKISMGNYSLANNFTIALWVYPLDNTQGENGIVIGKAGVLRILNGASWAGGQITIHVSIFTEGNENYGYFGSLLPANTWTHLVILKSGNTAKVYLNGVLSYTKTLSSANIDVNDNPLALNNFPQLSATRPQSYDDLLIFNRALSQEEVTALYLNKANTPKYFPQPTDKIEQGNWGLATSGGVYNEIDSRLSVLKSWSIRTPDYTKYILLADITKWYNGTSVSDVQAVSFIGKLIRNRSAGYAAHANCDITLAVGYYRGGVTFPNTQRTDIAKNNTSSSDNISVGIIQYNANYYLAVRIDTVQQADNYFFGYCSQAPLLTLLSDTDTVTEIYIV